MDGPQVISEAGYDSGVLDVGDGYVVTVHIESHNHPSAVEPYGGAATGVGGVIRDILSAGTRPIAILNGLRFGDIEGDPQARWLFRNAVAGIADYGNCLGIPHGGGGGRVRPVLYELCAGGRGGGRIWQKGQADQKPRRRGRLRGPAGRPPPGATASEARSLHPIPLTTQTAPRCRSPIRSPKRW